MHFEVTLRSNKTYENHFSYGLSFIPGPVWIKGDTHLINMSNAPELKKGCIKKLIEHEGLIELFKDNLEAVIVVRDIGHGTNEDLNTLQEDLSDEGFKVLTFGK